MVRSGFLLASKRVVQSAHKQPLSVAAKPDLLEEDDDSAALLEFDLAAAKEVSPHLKRNISPLKESPLQICIIDDPNAYSLFAGDIKAAPQVRCSCRICSCSLTLPLYRKI